MQEDPALICTKKTATMIWLSKMGFQQFSFGTNFMYTSNILNTWYGRASVFYPVHNDIWKVFVKKKKTTKKQDFSADVFYYWKYYRYPCFHITVKLVQIFFKNLLVNWFYFIAFLEWMYLSNPWYHDNIWFTDEIYKVMEMISHLINHADFKYIYAL